MCFSETLAAIAGSLQDVTRQIGRARKIAQMLLDESGIDQHGFARAVGGAEGEFLEDPLDHRVKPARADVLDRAVDLGGNPGQRADAIKDNAKTD